MTPLLFLIDDALEVIEIVEFLSERAGWQLRSARDVASAREQLRELKQWPDLILVDFHLPGENGLSLAQSLQSREVSLKRIALFSHLHMESTIAEALDVGIRAVVAKELIGQPKALLTRLSELIHGREALPLPAPVDTVTELQRRCRRLELMLGRHSIGSRVTDRLIDLAIQETLPDADQGKSSRTELLQAIVTRSQSSQFLSLLRSRVLSILGSEGATSLSSLWPGSEPRS